MTLTPYEKSRLWSCLKLGVYLGLFFVVLLIFGYKLIIDPVSVLVSLAEIAVFLLIVWFLIEYVFAGILAKLIAPVLALYFAAQVINAQPYLHYPIRCKRRRFRA